MNIARIHSRLCKRRSRCCCRRGEWRTAKWQRL